MKSGNKGNMKREKVPVRVRLGGGGQDENWDIGGGKWTLEGKSVGPLHP